MLNRYFIFSSVMILFSLTMASDAADVRYLVQFADGNRESSKLVTHWHDQKGEPRINNKKLFDENKPARWMMDLSQPLTVAPNASVELITGDRLPGEVIGFEHGGNDLNDQQFNHLIVQTHPNYLSPKHGDAIQKVRVYTHWIQKVIWEKRSLRSYQPGTLFLRDGRAFQYRAVRWLPDGLRVLRTQGTMTYSFQQIAELHFPDQDPWSAHLDQLAILSPNAESNLMQIETSEGLRLTTSMLRLHPDGGNDHKPKDWYHRMQPAWSLDPLWVKFETIRDWRFYEPNELLLSDLVPNNSEERRALGSSWKWQVNVNVQSGALRSAGKNFAWGYGVHAYTRLEFPLSNLVEGFRTSVGLDEVAGSGGCAQGIIAIATDKSSPQEVYRSPVLVGSEKLAESGMIDLKKFQHERATLQLIADPVYQNRPQGADPLDIRDTLDWLEPVLILDHQKLVNELQQRIPSLIPAWQQWEVENAENGVVSLESEWDESIEDHPAYRLSVQPRDKFLSFKRSLTVTTDQQWMILNAGQLQGDSKKHKKEKPEIQVEVNGMPIGKYELPTFRKGHDERPLAISLKPYIDQKVEVRITQMPDGEATSLDWRSIAFVSQPPGLIELFEDDPKFLTQLPDGEGQVAMESETKYSGASSFQVQGEEKSNPLIENLHVAIRARPELGEYRYVRFAWKKPEGTHISLQFANEGKFGIESSRTRGKEIYVRYDASRGHQSKGYAKRARGGIPKEWEVETRDLAGDFGDLNITGVGFECVDGKPAFFDHIYFARTMQDFEYINLPMGDK